MNGKLICPKCKWDFYFRKKLCCPGCGVRIVLISDKWPFPEKDFYTYDKRVGWRYVADIMEEMRDAMALLDSMHERALLKMETGKVQ